MKKKRDERQAEKPADFIDEIIRDARNGRTFVPFIGSGLSSASGIIMGMEFTNYLAFTTYLILCNPRDRERTHGEGQTLNWDLQRQGWPPLPSESEVNATRKWVMQQYVQLCIRLKLEPNYDSSDKHLIKSVSSTGSRNSLDDLMSALTQPSIPLIIRSPEFTANDYRAQHLNKFLGSESLTQLSPDILQLPHLADAGLSYEESLVETGLRSLGDWKETLTFLAMIRIVYSDPMRIILDSVDTSVIDAFNSTITRDKRPNLGHKIIAHLSGPLRVSTLLTTNFDTLTEDAYRALALPLTVLPVSARGALPPARTVASADTLIKLHGEAHDTRADLTLDREPSEEDKLTFCAYLTRGTGHLLRNRKQSAQSEPAKVTKRLLVIGYSGNDYRCIQMIKHWLETAPDDPRVYWICYSENDKRRLDDLFKSAKFSSKLVTTVSSRPDLLLYELYQKLVLSLPPGGLTYEFSHVLPPSRIPAYEHDVKTVSSTLESLRKAESVGKTISLVPDSLTRDAIVMHVKEAILNSVDGVVTDDLNQFCQVREWWPCYRLDDPDKWKMSSAEQAQIKKCPIVLNASSGVVRASSLAAEHLASQRYRKVFWMELQDYRDGDAILRDILRSIALRFGQFQSRHVTMHPLMSGLPCPSKPEEVAKAIDKLVNHLTSVLEEYRTDPTSIVFLLYGRNSYGNCAGLLSSTWQNSSKPNEFQRLHMIIEVLARVGIPTVYFPLTRSRAVRKIRALDNIRLKNVSISQTRCTPDMTVACWNYDEIGEKILDVRRADEPRHDVELLAQDTSAFSQTISKSLHAFYQFELSKRGNVTRIDLKPRAAQLYNHQLAFIYALTLFRHSRHPNSVCSEAVFSCPFRYGSKSIDNDFTRALQAERWAQDLQQAGVFFVKQGGSIWMHRDVRLAMQGIIENTQFAESNTDSNTSQNKPRTFLQLRAGMHYWIGDWYHKAFCSSGHLSPVTEGVHHMIMSAFYSQFAAPKREGDQLTYRLTMFESALTQASKLLLLSWQWVELWQASSCEVSWLSEKHALEIRDLLRTVPPVLLENQSELQSQFSSRLEEAIDKFVKVMRALGRAVLLEGGGADRLPCAELSPVTVALRLGADTARETAPQLAHGTQEIRKSITELEAEIVKALIRALSKLQTPTAEELWNCISKIAHDSPDEKENGKALAGIWKGLFKKSNYDSIHLHDLIWTLGEAAYVLLRHAKLHFHAHKTIDTVTWLKSTLCCNLAIDLCKLLPPALLDFEIQSKVKLHSIYGLGLANIGRFYEANRHLNEAQALLSKWNPSSQKEHATIALRRAEVKLTECYWISQFLGDSLNLDTIDFATFDNSVRYPASRASGLTAANTTFFLLPTLEDSDQECWRVSLLEKRTDCLTAQYPQFANELGSAPFVPPAIFDCLRTTKPIGLGSDDATIVARWKADAQQMLRRLYASILDEAVKLLEIGEKNLAGVSQSNLWWSRLRTLSLRVYGLLSHLPQTAETSLVFRKQSADLGIFKNFLSAVRIAGEDDFRLLRAVRYFAEANRWFCEFMEECKPEQTNRLLVRTFYQRYLPDSIRVAQGVFKEISDKSLRQSCGTDDLLNLAIENCRSEFPEIDLS